MGVGWFDIFVPLIGGNGYLMQFAVVTVLPPAFPYTIMISKVLDLTDGTDRLKAAGYILMVSNFVSMALEKKEEFKIADLNQIAGVSTELYHMKLDTEFFKSKNDYNDSLLHLFAVMSALFVDDNLRAHILFPICVRQFANESQLVFCNLGDYSIGVPDDADLRKSYIDAVESVLQRIHAKGVVHLDFYPSNVIWKAIEDTKVDIVIIDWDSAHFVVEQLGDCVTSRMPRIRNELAARYAVNENRPLNLMDYDLSLFKLL